MSNRSPILSVSSTTAISVLCAAIASAQWSSNPATNLSVADAASDQVQAKIAPAADGGTYISWLDGIANGFDTRVQLLDALGNELMPHNGVLVIDTGFSSTQDYGMDVDASGNALLVNRDDSMTGTQITAQKVTPSGTLAWGATGVQLTSTTDFVAAPKICGTSDGGAVVAWTQLSSVRVQKLDASGAIVWGADVVLTPAMGSYSASDLHDSGNDAILAIVHQTGSFGSPRHLVAQKFDSAGATLWGPAAVFDGGSLQLGNFPTFIPDENGGAVFGWYSSSPSLQCRAQHILADGTEAYPHNGSEGSTDATQVRVNPSVTYKPNTDETFLFWTEQNSLQSQFGLYGQKFDATGNRLWGANGSALIALSATEIQQVRAQAYGPGAFVYWAEGGFGAQVVNGGRVDGAGAFDVAAFSVASTSSSKSRLALARNASSESVLAWTDDRVDAGDVLAQIVNFDGALGGSTGEAYCFSDELDPTVTADCPCTNFGDPGSGCANSNATLGGARLTASGTTVPNTLVFTCTGIPNNNLCTFLRGNVTTSPGFAFGDGVRCVSGTVLRFGQQTSGQGGNPPNTVASGAIALSPGQTRYYQLHYRNPSAGFCPPEAFNVSNAYRVTW